MEKRSGKKLSNVKSIVITGPESTGKTSISSYLAGQLGCPWISEYARDYIGSLDRSYNYNDLLHIAETQIRQKIEIQNAGASLLILDTWLIITKVWFIEVYGKYPIWLDKEIMEHKIDLFLVCKPDIPWIPDPLRENGGEKRDYLMNRYIDEIKSIGCDYSIIEGIDEERYLNALKAVNFHFNL